MTQISLTPIYAVASMLCLGGAIALLVSPAAGLISLGIMFGLLTLLIVVAK